YRRFDALCAESRGGTLRPGRPARRRSSVSRWRWPGRSSTICAAQLPSRDRRSRAMKRAAALFLTVGLLGGCTSLKRFSYEGFSRDGWQQPGRVIAALGVHRGDRVAALGAGSGYFTLRLARAVGPSGRVYAVDVDEAMNAYLRERVAQAGLSNVEVILGRFEDPLLPDGGIDLVLVVDTYHHLEDR